MAEQQEQNKEGLVLVTRKPCFNLPTGCPICLPIYIYLKFAKVSFTMHFDTANPDSADIPYVEHGDYVAFNSERGGVIEGLKEDSIIDLDSKLPSHTIPDWWSTKAMISTWLEDAAKYELWVGSDGSAARKIYFSNLPWPISMILHHKQTRAVRQLLGITKSSVEEREAEIYRQATLAYEALSTRLGEQTFFFENRPTSLDALFLGHALFVLQAFSETSVLKSKLVKHGNLVRYAENLNMEFLEASSSSSYVPIYPFKGGPPDGSFKPKNKVKKERSEKDKAFVSRAKRFLVAQAVAIILFLTVMGRSDNADADMDDDNGLDSED